MKTQTKISLLEKVAYTGLIISTLMLGKLCYEESKQTKARKGPVRKYSEYETMNILETENPIGKYKFIDRDHDDRPESIDIEVELSGETTETRTINSDQLEDAVAEAHYESLVKMYVTERNKIVKEHVEKFLDLIIGKEPGREIEIRKFLNNNGWTTIFSIEDEDDNHYISRQYEDGTDDFFLFAYSNNQSISIQSAITQDLKNMITGLTEKALQGYKTDFSAKELTKMIEDCDKDIRFMSFGSNFNKVQRSAIKHSLDPEYKWRRLALAELIIPLENGNLFFQDKDNDNNPDSAYLEINGNDFLLEIRYESDAIVEHGLDNIYRNYRDNLIKTHASKAGDRSFPSRRLRVNGDGATYSSAWNTDDFAEMRMDLANDIMYRAMNSGTSEITTYFTVTKRDGKQRTDLVSIFGDDTEHTTKLIGNVVNSYGRRPMMHLENKLQMR